MDIESVVDEANMTHPASASCQLYRCGPMHGWVARSFDLLSLEEVHARDHRFPKATRRFLRAGIALQFAIG